MTLIERLRKRCETAGLHIPNGAIIRRTHAGRHQKACGAWSWFLVDADNRWLSLGIRGQIGSQWPASLLVKGKIEWEKDSWGDVSIDPAKSRQHVLLRKEAR